METISQQKYQNLILALQEQQEGAERVQSHPAALVLDPASACNLRCRFCIHGRNDQPRVFHLMPLPLFHRVVEELSLYLFEVELFNWGEPLLHPDILEMIATLKARHIRVRLSTHFSLNLTDSFLDSLIRLRLDVLTISLDGMSQDTYARYRVGGDFRLAMANLERLALMKRRLKAELPRIDWQFLVFSFNEAELPAARAHARRIGVDLRPAVPYVDLVQEPSWLAEDDRYILERYRSARLPVLPPPALGMPVKEAVTERAQDSLAMSESMSPADPKPAKTLPPDNDTSTPTVGADNESTPSIGDSHLANCANTPCDWLYLKATLNADRTFSPCCGLPPGEPSFGNLDGRPFAEIWNGQAFRFARRTLTQVVPPANATGVVCGRCPFPEMQADFRLKAYRELDRAPDLLRTEARRRLPGYAGHQRWPGWLKRRAVDLIHKLPYRLRQVLLQRLRGQATYGVLSRWLERAGARR